jgi:hypothetical protein
VKAGGEAGGIRVKERWEAGRLEARSRKKIDAES